MYIDISAYQGAIDWQKVAQNKDINGIIMRATTQNGNLDKRLLENYNGVLRNMSDINEISVYKMTYARDYVSARVECWKCLYELKEHGVHFDGFYLDIEKNSNKDYTTNEANAVILGYYDEMQNFDYSNRLGLYFNYNYLKNIIAPVWRQISRFPIWLARYNTTMGDVSGWNVRLWQYTSVGRIDGINGDVDISREVIL